MAKPNVVHVAGSDSAEIVVAPSGNLNPTLVAAIVTVGAMKVAMYSPAAIAIVPVMMVRTTLPRKIGTIMATMNGMVARSPNGSTRLPGSTSASTSVIGISTSEAAMTAGEPTAMAESSPI